MCGNCRTRAKTHSRNFRKSEPWSKALPSSTALVSRRRSGSGLWSKRCSLLARRSQSSSPSTARSRSGSRAARSLTTRRLLLGAGGSKDERRWNVNGIAQTTTPPILHRVRRDMLRSLKSGLWVKQLPDDCLIEHWMRSQSTRTVGFGPVGHSALLASRWQDRQSLTQPAYTHDRAEWLDKTGDTVFRVQFCSFLR